MGASEATVAAETKKLKELQNIAMKNFRQELAQKLRRQKSKASYIKEKFGLGPGGGPVSSHGHRLSKAKSVALASSPIKEELPSIKEAAWTQSGSSGTGQLKRIRSGEALDTSEADDDYPGNPLFVHAFPEF